MMKRIVLFMLIISLCFVSGCTKEKNENVIDFAAVSERLIDLNAEKGILERDLAQLMEEYEIALSGGESCFVFFADNIDSNLMEYIFPTLKDYGTQGTVVMSELKAPGVDGCISLEDYNTLKEAGWDFAIGTGETIFSKDNELNELKAYIDSYRELLSQKGVEMPVTFCFQEAPYDKNYDQILIEEGFKVVRCDRGLDEKFSRAIERNGLYILGSGLMKANSTSTLKREMTSVYENSYTYSIVVKKLLNSVSNKSEECTVAKYKSMLNFVETDCVGANIFTATELYEYKSEAVVLESGFKEEDLKIIEEKEKRINEIENEIEEINTMLRNY